MCMGGVPAAVTPAAPPPPPTPPPTPIAVSDQNTGVGQVNSKARGVGSLTIPMTMGGLPGSAGLAIPGS